jgi:hypothetical protein
VNASRISHLPTACNKRLVDAAPRQPTIRVRNLG